jgi:hypothetical protein
MVGNNENVLVNLDCQNIVLIDPNKTVSSDGRIGDRMLKHENLVYYANLECSLFPRTRLAVGANGNLNNETISIARLNFISPGNKKFLNNEYTDEITGLRTISGFGNEYQLNQNFYEQSSKSNNVLSESVDDLESELLGITQITVDSNLSFTPEVTIEMEDIRGRALFEKGENSPYAVFFNYPYPLFYLTLKGYLGQAIKYQLALRTFNARFDTDTGNFKISVKFYAYKYNILTQLPMKYMINTPYMYRKKYTLSPTRPSTVQTAQNQLNNTNANVLDITSSRGYEKIKEVYSEYKSKGLISQDFPELTIPELMVRLENLETFIANTFTEADLSPLTDGKNFRNTLSTYIGEVFGYAGTDSWAGKYLDLKNFYIYRGDKIYTFKKEVESSLLINQAINELKSIISKNNTTLTQNRTFGIGGTYEIGKISNNSANPTNITYELINNNAIYFDDINLNETYFKRTGQQPNDLSPDFLNFKNEQQRFFFSLNRNWFKFEGENSFAKQIDLMSNLIDTQIESIQTKLTEVLSIRLKDKEGGLGFLPTIRNVTAIILANTEGFIRLMCEVHEKAWDLRNDEDRIKSILPSDRTVTSVDAKDYVKLTNENLIPVYPWPQYFVEKNVENGERFVLTYPGDASVILKTKAFNYAKWPEVEFVEEFLKADVITKESGNLTQNIPFVNQQQVINKVSLNAIDFPTKEIIYSNKQENKFFYEIYERLILSSFYQKFNKAGIKQNVSNLISEAESINIQNALGVDSPSLIQKLKRYTFNSGNYIPFLTTISNNGIGENWQKFIRGEFVTPYISEEVNESFVIYDSSIANVGVNVVQPEPSELSRLSSYLTTQESNDFDFTDVFPYNTSNWFTNNLSDGQKSSLRNSYNTTNTLEVNFDKKMVANFSPQTTTKQKRPITNFNYNLALENPTPTNNTLKGFYDSRTYSNMYPTEGGLTYINYSGNNTANQTTSMLNTPYFVNSIQEGVERWLTGDTTPYVSTAYLFINSLPISTLREKYKTFNSNGTTTDLDYIFSTFKKFGAIHKLPYAWVLKYGSVWHRYKKWVEEGVDILQTSWSGFNNTYNFDPITSNPNKTYNLNVNSVQQEITQQKTTTIGTDTFSELNVGFYPKVINDFSIFLRGYDLFTTYSDSEIQNELTNTSSGFTLTYGDDSSFYLNKEYDKQNLNDSLRFKTWTTTLVDDLTKKQYIVPSFGTNINQTYVECISDNNSLLVNIKNNTSVTNGAVRLFWNLPNYGFFNSDKIILPSPEKYLKQILSNESQQQSFSMNGVDNFSTIEETLSIFEKDILDKFETEFLNFSKSMYSFKIENIDTSSSGTTITRVLLDTLPENSNGIYKNIQLLLRELLSVTPKKYTESSQFINDLSNEQLTKFNQTIRNFLEYDIVIKYGNPSQYDRKVYDTFSNVNYIEDKLTFPPYVENSLPTNGGTTTLSQSISAYPQVWKDLRTYVGFSTIPRIQYSNTGSTITDFFVDMNIAFTSESVKSLAPLIKIYATRKYNNPSYNETQFINELNAYVTETNSYLNLSLNSLFQKLQLNLPNVTETNLSSTDTAIQGEQVKIDLWEKFKGINDAWISGYDYTQTNFLEDVLFLDRANRDIGDDILIDPLKIRTGLSNLSEGTSVLVYLTSIFTEHNFITMVSPSYINYYNVQDVQKITQPKYENSSDFANNLFGTFLSVDTRKTSPKIVCMFNYVPSEHLAMEKNKTIRFKNDAFNFGCSGDNPLITDYKNQKDYSRINRVVGFNVDIGVRNQNIFYRFNVSQEVGKATSESMQQVTNMIEQYNSKMTATQNVSLWNFFNKRSYESTVQCLGNAMIQPTMYFNLNHVPMFNGPYWITEVKHNVTSGRFETTFKGVRQQIFSLPKIDNYIQMVTKRIFNDLIKNTTQNVVTNQTTLAQNVTNLNTNQTRFEIASNNTCADILNSKFSEYTPATQLSVTSTSEEIINGLKTYVNGGTIPTNTRLISFVTIYLATYDNSNKQFNCWNNNFCGAQLNINWRGASPNFFKKEYLCLYLNNGQSIPFATFEDTKQMFSFLDTIWAPLSSVVKQTPENLFELWKKNFNQNNIMTLQDFITYKNNNPVEYQSYIAKVTEAIRLAKTLYLI